MPLILEVKRQDKTLNNLLIQGDQIIDYSSTWYFSFFFFHTENKNDDEIKAEIFVLRLALLQHSSTDENVLFLWVLITVLFHSTLI